MFVAPVPFSIQGSHMLRHAKWLLEEKEEDGSSLIAIHKDFHRSKNCSSLRIQARQITDFL
jgi:hypothetical protein